MGNREGKGHIMNLEVDGNVILFLYLNILFMDAVSVRRLHRIDWPDVLEMGLGW